MNQPTPGFDTKSFHASILKTVIENRLWDFQSRLLLAVSGGRDSMAMFRAFCTLAPDPTHQLAVAHIDHAVRPESADDALFVETAAKNANVPCMCVRLPRADPPVGLSSEDYWRRERYRILLAMMKHTGASAVATAHTATDQLETMLMRLTSGSGPRGFLGIRIHRADGIIRPMLNVTRDDVAAYAVTSNLTWHEDISNKDTRKPRNAIRAQVIPILRRLNPKVESATVRAAQLLQEEDAVLSDEALQVLKMSGWRGWMPAKLDCRPFGERPFAIARRCAAALYDFIGHHTPVRVRSEHVNRLAHCLTGHIDFCPLPGGAYARLHATAVLLIPPIPDSAMNREVPLADTGAFIIGAYEVFSEPSPFCAEATPDNGVQGQTLRTRRKGDRVDLEMSGRSRPISEFFRTADLSVPIRACLPLVADDRGCIRFIFNSFEESGVLVITAGGALRKLTCRPVWGIR